MWDALSDWLLAAYPDDMPMPLPKGKKCPAFPHSGNRWSWHRYRRFTDTHNALKYDVAILLQALCVVDVDSHELATQLEQKFPVLRTCPMEETRKGRHYFFQRSALCDNLGFMDQRSGVIPNVDFKTRCHTGTAGVIAVAPSEGKRWVRTPWTCGDILESIPDDLLRAVAVPMRRMADVTLTFSDGTEVTYHDNPHLHKFGLLHTIMGDDDGGPVQVPLPLGTAQLFEDIMYFCEHRQHQRWPVDVHAMQRLADYMCASHKLMKALDAGSPTSPTAWLQCIDDASPGWGAACVSGTLVDITDGHPLTYQPLKRNDQWLFHDCTSIDVQEGATVLRHDISQRISELPGIVQDVLERHPELVLSGSSVLHLACSRALGDPSDYDMYFVGSDEERLREILNDICRHFRPDAIHRTGSAITFVVDSVTVQIILRRYRDIQHILKTFDLAPAQCAMHAGRIMVTPNWLVSVQHMAAYVNFWHWNPASVSRAFKYYGKGFEILVPALRRDMVQAHAPGPGVQNLLAVEHARVSSWWMGTAKRDRDGALKRTDAKTLRRMVRKHNYWGAKHQSGYDEYVGGSIQHVIASMLGRGFTWLGLRPLKTSTPMQEGFDDLAIPEATDMPFQTTSPNFAQFYRAQLQQ